MIKKKIRRRDPGFFKALRLAAVEIERKIAATRLAARLVGKEIVLMRDNFGTLRMVFVEPVEQVRRAKQDLVSTMRSPVKPMFVMK